MTTNNNGYFSDLAVNVF